MAEISYRRHRFPPVINQHAVWLCLRFTLSYRGQVIASSARDSFCSTEVNLTAPE
jgi:hypothetical protein